MLREELLELKNESNADFQAKLMPGIARETVLGIKIPILRTVEKKYRNTVESEKFIKELPHKYFDENLLHGIFISNLNDYDRVIEELEQFFPYIDNWAVCDTIRPKAFKKHKAELLTKIREWISSEKTYTIRFGIEMLMTYYLDESFEDEYLELVAGVRSEEYYVNMMIAWYFATALAKQWDATFPYIESKKLPLWVHNKSIQKARESFRITEDQKIILKSLKM